MTILDRILACLLILGGIGHTAGTLIGYKDRPELMLWSLCASAFIFLLGTVNLIRTGRPGDLPLAWTSLIFNLCWLAATSQFGLLFQNFMDPRVIGFAAISLSLCVMSLRSMKLKVAGPKIQA